MGKSNLGRLLVNNLLNHSKVRVRHWAAEAGQPAGCVAGQEPGRDGRNNTWAHGA